MGGKQDLGPTPLFMADQVAQGVCGTGIHVGGGQGAEHPGDSPSLPEGPWQAFRACKISISSMSVHSFSAKCPTKARIRARAASASRRQVTPDGVRG